MISQSPSHIYSQYRGDWETPFHHSSLLVRTTWTVSCSLAEILAAGASSSLCPSKPYVLSVSTGSCSRRAIHVGMTDRPSQLFSKHHVSTASRQQIGLYNLPRRIVLTARGTLPPFQSRVFRPKETACAKLSCPRRIPLNLAVYNQ